MSTRKWLAGGAAVAVLAITGCSGGATVKSTIAKGSPFCVDLASFRDQIVALSNEANATLTSLQQQVPPVRDALVKLVGEAPATDTVNGHSVKADLQTVANVYSALVTALQNANPNGTDPAENALATVEAQQGAALTQATGRLDSYTKDVCGISIAPAPTSTTAAAPGAAPTTAAPVTAGPGAATTAAPGAATTVAPVGPVGPAPATTAAP